MKAQDPRRNLIQTWSWGDKVDVYVSAKDAPRWIRNKGMMFSRCDVAGCDEIPAKGDWYVRHPGFGVVCARCAPDFGATVPAA
jgi:hypothetical protein